MKRLLSPVLLFCLLFYDAAQAQGGAKLTMPASPAFSILNYEPTAVMRPANARELAADVLSSFDKDGKLLMNLGLEVMPYWLKSRPTLDRATYLRPSVAQAFRQSFSISAATVKDTLSGNNRLGSGFRFRLLNGKPVNELAEASRQQTANNTVLSIIAGLRANIDTGDTRQDIIAALTSNLQRGKVDAATIVAVQEEATALSAAFNDTVADLNRFLNQLIEARSAAGTELSRNVSDLLYERQGFFLEFAGATAFNTRGDNGLEQVGIWANASYYVSPTDQLTLTGRYFYQDDAVNDTTSKNFDLGLGFLKKTSNYNVALEAMLRWYDARFVTTLPGGGTSITNSNAFTYRVAVQGSYTITRDISLNLSFGKHFDSPFLTGSGFFSILGFNFSIFEKDRPQLLDVPSAAN